MPGLFLDPNYHPATSYPMVEGLLMLGRPIFLAAPNAVLLERIRLTNHRISLSPDRLWQLIEHGFVQPFASPNWWDKEARAETKARILRDDQDELRSEIFGWTDLDDKIINNLDAKKRISDDKFHKVGEFVKNIQETNQELYEGVRSDVSNLRRQRKVPEEFYANSRKQLSDDQVCARLLEHVGNDLGTVSLVGASSLILPEATIYISRHLNLIIDTLTTSPSLSE